MARIDSLISTLIDSGIPLAAVQPDRPVMLDMGGGDTRPLSNRAITAKQIEMLVQEVASEEDRDSLRKVGRVEFEYESPAGPAVLMAMRRGGRLTLYVNITRALENRPMNDVQALDEESSVVVVDSMTGRSGQDFSKPSEPELEESSVELSNRRQDFSRGGQQNSKFVQADARPAQAQTHRQAEASLEEERLLPMKEPGQTAPIDRLFRIMEREGCSDLHLTSGNPPLYRKDGEIVPIGDDGSLSPAEVERLLLPIMPDQNYEEFIERRDTDFAYEIPDVGRFRCNVFMDRIGPGAVFRIIPSEILTAEDLKLPKKILDLCFLTKGLVVVTGPTGSGKSTTLAAMIDYINRKRSAHIITVEDPIEFVHPNKKCLINQREIGVHTMSFKNALRAALREDPDIVLVGEMRDLETIAIAIETAETGHLVFGTLHTNTAPSTVDRIIDQFPSGQQAQVRTMLSESLKAVIAQTLCKKVGGGRIAALETLMVDHAVANLIRESKTFQIPSVMSTKKAAGNKMLNTSLLELVKDGKVEPNEAYLKAVDKDSLRKSLERAGHRVTI